MRVLVACEESQAVCLAFREKGYEAFSCDIQECSGGHPEWHFQEDVFKVINMGWDLLIGHPPCTYLSNAGIGYFNEDKWGIKATERKLKRSDAFDFFMKLYNCPVPKVCLENPVGWPNSAFRKPDQVIQPYYFGDNHRKTTCLWLKGLPKLVHTIHDDLFSVKTHIPHPEPLAVQYRKPSKYYSGGEEKKRYFTDTLRKAKERSKTFPGIAKAMADQWG